MIPGIIHQVWVGENPIPDQDKEFADTLRCRKILWAEHPDNHEGPWDEVRPLPTLAMQYCIDLLRDRAKTPFFYALFSDIARVEILAQQGGIYLDTDVFQVRDILPVIGNKTLVISQEFSNRMVGNFMIAGTKGHPAFYRFMELVHQRITEFVPSQHSTFNPVGITGPLVVEHAFKKSCDCVVLPFPYFSPWSQQHPLPHNWKDIPWPEPTVAVHAFSSKWVNTRKSRSSTLRDGMTPTWESRAKPLGGCG